MRMRESDVHDYARQLLEAHGDGAVAEVAERACACEQRGEAVQLVQRPGLDVAVLLVGDAEPDLDEDRHLDDGGDHPQGADAQLLAPVGGAFRTNLDAPNPYCGF